jgi:hypothetical protein
MALEITYYTQAVNNMNHYGLPITSETRTASGTSAQSGATPANAVTIHIRSTANNRYAYGSNPTATATAGDNGHYIASGETIDIQAVSGHKIAVITAA